ncbi:MAG: hypothetical protein A2X64_05395 [Ignavibacteria bacterium GWF2_33_9]|nr:MAG: hypothetical protein A2X64_05395 [Ignavibacteria bacterium GWF2_33_9]
MIDQENIEPEKICINAITDELAKVRELVEMHIQEMGFSEEKQFSIKLVIDEICSNIIKHSYTTVQKPEDDYLKICIEIQKEVNKLIVKIFDQGPPFNPVEYHSQELSEKIKHPHKGGLGITLVKLLSDNLSYSRLDSDPQSNLLEITFFKN